MLNITRAPKYLKQSIIDEALRGRLTKRSINDDSVSDLLKHIADNKNKLIKEKLVRRHNLPKISTDELLFKIPSNWKWIRLGDLINLHSGLSYKKKNLSRNNSDIRIIRGGNISNNGALILKDNDYHINQKFINNKNVFLHNGQLLTPVATSPKHIAKIAIVKHLASKVVAGGFVYQLTPYLMNSILSKFLLYALSGRSIRKEILSITHLSGSALCNLPKTKFLKIIIPLPPLAEQHRIVQRLNEILPKVDDLNKDVVKLDQIRTKFPHRLKQSLLLEAMKGHLTQQLPSDGNAHILIDSLISRKKILIKKHKIRKRRNLLRINKNTLPFQIPSNWMWVRLGSITDIRSASRVHKSDWKSSGIPFYRAREIVSLSKNKPLKSPIYIDRNTYINKIKKSGKPKKGDMLFTGVGTLGTSWIVPNNNDFYYKDASVLCLHNINKMLDIYYINMFFKSPVFANQVKDLSKGTAVKTLTITNSSNLLIPIPPLSEQHRIVNKLKNIFSKL